MARPLKFPGLQTKFESALQDILAEEPLRGNDILERVVKRSMKYGFAVAELKDIQKNISNYMARAKGAALVRSGGPWGGYELIVRRAKPKRTRVNASLARPQLPARRTSASEARQKTPRSRAANTTVA